MVNQKLNIYRLVRISICMHSCCIVVLHIRLNWVFMLLCPPPLSMWQCSPAVPCYWGSNCTVSLCFTLCAQPYITPAFAHCAILQPQELCITLCNSHNLVEKFVLSSAGFKTGQGLTQSAQYYSLNPSTHWSLLYLLKYAVCTAKIITERIYSLSKLFIYKSIYS